MITVIKLITGSLFFNRTKNQKFIFGPAWKTETLSSLNSFGAEKQTYWVVLTVDFPKKDYFNIL